MRLNLAPRSSPIRESAHVDLESPPKPALARFCASVKEINGEAKAQISEQGPGHAPDGALAEYVNVQYIFHIFYGIGPNEP